MIYLDYSATTPVNKAVLDSFCKVSLEYPGNPNSLHKLGTAANKVLTAATKQIADILGVKESEIIYTSGSSESNNTAIKGVFNKYKNRGKHIITTDYEHSSIYGPIANLQNDGAEVDFVKCDEFGRVDLDNLKSLIRPDTILVSITAVNSEIGILEPVEEIGKFLKENYPNIFFHVDMTQILGKKKLDLTNIDMASFSAHKIYGIKGIGCLIKKDNISIEPLIHGGKSTTIYRSGTPAPALVVSTAKALRLIYENNEDKYNYVNNLNKLLKEKLSKYEDVFVNSNEYCMPHVLNVSVVGVKPETMLHALEEFDIYISTQTACSSAKSISKAVMALTNSEERATSSIRISLSHLTTEDEINKFDEVFAKCYKKLKELK